MYSLQNNLCLNSIIGKSFNLIGSTALHVDAGKITSYEMNFLLNFEKTNILFACDYENGFKENESGEIFYDFVCSRVQDDSSSQKSTVTFNTSKILEINILGRKFEDKKTNDLFIFNCKDGERIVLVFHPYFPSFELYFSETSIQNFFKEYNKKYLDYGNPIKSGYSSIP